MSIFKKKPKPKTRKKPTVVVRKSKPPQWSPPFGSRDYKIFPVSQAEEPKPIEEAPTYMLPAPPKEEKIPLIDILEEPVAAPRPKHTVDGKTPRQAFIASFRKLTNGQWRSWDVWADFVTLTACTISNTVDKAHFDEREVLYLSIINKYSKEEQKIFPELFAHTVMALEENPEQDFLGDIYSELGLNSKERQQIFTPYHVARMMAEISMGDLPKQIEEKGYVSIMDCCCGAGATLIGAINVAKNQLEKADLNFQNHVLIVGQDIDRVVAMMCYIQVSLLGVAGYFKVGNALTEPMTAGDSLENYWFTPVYFFPVWQYRRIFRQMNDMVVSTDPSGGNEHGEV